MTLSVELTDKQEVQYKFLRDIYFGGKKTNKEVVEWLIQKNINYLNTFKTYDNLLEMLVEAKVITDEERKILCQMN